MRRPERFENAFLMEWNNKVSTFEVSEDEAATSKQWPRRENGSVKK
jgi:hypothetical protein